MALDAVFIGTHPDDIELTSGGLAALLASHGHEIGLVDLTRGEAATRGTTAEREREAQAAAVSLGVTMRRNLGLPDLGLNAGDPAQLRAVVACLRAHRPRLVVAPERHDLHPDHVEASRMVHRACHLAGLVGFEAPGEPFRPARVLFALYRAIRRPHLVVDVTSVWERRMSALREHRTQLGPGPGPETYLSAPGFLEEVTARARVFGASIGTRFGEGYRAAGPIPVQDARVLLGTRS